VRKRPARQQMPNFAPQEQQAPPKRYRDQAEAARCEQQENQPPNIHAP